MTAFRSFAAALHTQAPAPDRADAMGLYGWLVGDWEMDAIIHVDDGSTKTGKGEIHFGFVLEGRAIQDVWILPGVFFGTTTSSLPMASRSSSVSSSLASSDRLGSWERTTRRAVCCVSGSVTTGASAAR